MTLFTNAGVIHWPETGTIHSFPLLVLQDISYTIKGQFDSSSFD